MAKVLFLFMSKSSAGIGSTKDDYWKNQDCGEGYKNHNDECYFKMFEDLMKNGTITDLKVFYESGVCPGKADFVPGAVNYVIPEIRLVREYIDDDTIIFVRGGFKHWHDLLLEYKDKNWLICYAANTGRDKWSWWDIIFDDLSMENIIDVHGRYYFPFIKPVNEDIFFPVDTLFQYDVCIGASHIHDKKGQWRSIEVLEKFHQEFSYLLKAVMPGAIRRSTNTGRMIEKPIFRNDIICPGMLSKPDLATVFNRSKVFLHLGTGGQNDRSILEAHACGIPVVLANTRRFTPLLKHDGLSTYHFGFGNSPEPEESAYALKLILDDYALRDQSRVFNYHKKLKIANIYKKRMGYQEIVLPMLTKFFGMLGGTTPSYEMKEKLMKAFEYINKGEIK